jgi:hypothetical protein
VWSLIQRMKEILTEVSADVKPGFPLNITVSTGQRNLVGLFLSFSDFLVLANMFRCLGNR